MDSLPSTPIEVLFKREFLHRHFVRCHMTILVIATMAAGLAATKLMLLAGLTRVEFRYPLATVIAVLSFLGFTRLWIGYVRSRYAHRRGLERRSGLEGPSRLDWSDVPDPDVPWPEHADPIFCGGDSGGAGASDGCGDYSFSSTAPPEPTAGGHGGLHSILDIDEFGILVLAGALLVASVGAGAYLIYTAPAIMPDVAFNAIVASGVASAAKRGGSTWIARLFRHMRLPVAAVLTITIALGTGIDRYCPSAIKLADVRGCAVRSGR